MNLRTFLAAAITLFLLAACQSPPPDDPGGGNGDGNGTGSVPEAPWEARDIPGHFPGRSGEVVTVDLNGSDFTYEVIDGLAIYQADMVLGEASDVASAFAALDSELHTAGSICDHEHIATLFGWFCGRWADATVPYSIRADWATEEINQERRDVIMQAIAHWEANTGLRFVEATGGVRMEFRDGDGCSSRVGRQENIFGEPQPVRLHPDCTLGSAIHEIGHAVGLHHEQSRNDRDAYVRVLSENIESGKGHNFNRAGDSGNDIGPYDYGSNMHYGCYGFHIDGRPTLEILDPTVTCADLGSEELSDTDILSAYVMYPPSFTVSSVASSYQRTMPLQPRISTERAIPGRHFSWFLDGTEVGDGHNPTISLFGADVGTHRVEARMIIAGVEVDRASAQFEVTNIAPSVSILTPEAGSEVCVDQPIEFRAQVVDGDNSPGFTLPDEAVVWSEIGGGELGAGSVLSSAFSSAGNRTVTVTVTDSAGALAFKSVQFSVRHCTSLPPAVTITAPVEGFSGVVEGNDGEGFYLDVRFAGEAFDPEDGELSGASLEWHTNLGELQPGGESLLGTGGNMTARLYTTCGHTHLVTLTATDSDGLSGSAIRAVRLDNLC